jgi:deazaflavin-dependent oxidoreductase (nitroreductase family)
MPDAKRRVVTLVQRYLANPVNRRLPGQAVIETIGRKSGLPRVVPVGGRIEDGAFWLVSEHGLDCNYVRNIAANPRVRVRSEGRWYTGTANLLSDDDPVQRLGRLPRLNGLVVRLLGTNLLTIRVDLDA